MEDNNFLTQSLLGLTLACKASVTALTHSRELQSIGLKSLLYLGLSAWAAYLTINIALMPIRLGYRIATLFIYSLDKQMIAKQTEETAFAAMKSVPELFLYLLRYAYPRPLDELFFSSSPTSIARMASLKGRASTMKRIQLFLKRAIRLGLLLIIQAICFRILGKWASYIAFAFSMYRILGLHGIATVIVLTLVTSLKVLDVVKTIVRVRALSREIMDPYVSRSRLNDKQRRAWFHKHTYIIASFTFPFYLGMQIPYIGWMAFGLAIASAPILCANIMDASDVV